jgi:hypothetical protein
MATNKVSYLNKTFNDFRDNLINYTKTYYPNTFNDFSGANPGSLFIELASYIGDVASFYADTQIQETFLLYAKEKENLYALSYVLGYRPRVSYASSVIMDIYQLIPSKIDPTTGQILPNYDFALIVPENTQLTSNSTGIKFLTTDRVDFTDITNTEVSFVDNNTFLLKKQVNAISAEIRSTTLNFSSPQKFQLATITDTNILQILDATDTQGNKWYEVPYLAQSTILDKISNPNATSDGVPYLINYQRVPRRYVSRFLSNNTLQLEFGAGIGDTSDSNILPNPDNISLGLIPGTNNYINNYNKATPFFTQEYGIAPSNNITIRYLVGGGIASNVSANDIIKIDGTNSSFPKGVTGNTADTIKASLACTNPLPSSGGRGGDEIEELRNNALYAYQSQLRAVTKEDYMVRALSIPADYGSIAKVYVTQDMISMVSTSSLATPTVATTGERNPLSLDMYILAYNSNKQLIPASTTLKQNLATYINQYRMVTDAINIKDAFYINIGINFDIVVRSGFNNNDVITNGIIALKSFFNIDRWSINQPIIISDALSVLLSVEGIQSVTKFEIINKQDNAGITYSQYAYDISGATRQGNIYPSLDPSIFEVRYPDVDIQGRVVPFVI